MNYRVADSKKVLQIAGPYKYLIIARKKAKKLNKEESTTKYHVIPTWRG